MLNRSCSQKYNAICKKSLFIIDCGYINFQRLEVILNSVFNYET